MAGIPAHAPPGTHPCHLCGKPTPNNTGAQACQPCITAGAEAFWPAWRAAGGDTAWADIQAQLTLARDGWPKLDPATWQPVPGDTPKCGNMTSLPRRQRRHPWLDAGEGTLHDNDGSYKQVTVLICARCGTTKYHTLEGT